MTILMPRSANALFCCSLLTLTLSACVSLGQKALPKGPETPQYALAPCNAETADIAEAADHPGPVAPFEIQGKQLPLQVRSTAKTPWNTHLRYVYPYTKSTVQFEVSITHPLKTASPEKTVTLAEAVSLKLSEPIESTELVQSLPFAYWERVWPASAARSDQELHDRSIAMGEVIKQRWQSRMLYPGETYTALVIFPSAVLSQSPQKLTFTYQTPSKEDTISLCLTPKDSPSNASE
jgi:hypothetical protein